MYRRVCFRQEETAFLGQVREEIRRSVTSALEEQSARGATPAASSGAFTPTVQQQQQQLRQQIVQLVKLKQWNGAFQMVSSGRWPGFVGRGGSRGRAEAGIGAGTDGVGADAIMNGG